MGKTTSTVNIAAGLLENNHCNSILLIDLDPQANLTRSLGQKPDSENIYSAFCGKKKISPKKILPNLFLVPSSLDLSGAEAEVSNKIGREMLLKRLLKPIKNKFDFIFIDCPPSLGLLTINALTSCDKLIVPVQTQFLAVSGLLEFKDIIEEVKKHLNRKLEINGILLTQYDKRKILDREAAKNVEHSFGKKVFKSKIRTNVSLAEAPSKGKDIFSYAPNSHGAEDYRALVKELIRRLRK